MIRAYSHSISKESTPHSYAEYLVRRDRVEMWCVLYVLSVRVPCVRVVRVKGGHMPMDALRVRSIDTVAKNWGFVVS